MTTERYQQVPDEPEPGPGLREELARLRAAVSDIADRMVERAEGGDNPGDCAAMAEFAEELRGLADTAAHKAADLEGDADRLRELLAQTTRALHVALHHATGGFGPASEIVGCRKAFQDARRELHATARHPAVAP